jgi:hypothetical protein
LKYANWAAAFVAYFNPAEAERSLADGGDGALSSAHGNAGSSFLTSTAAARIEASS